MNQLRQAAARERRAPIVWWFLLMLLTGGALVAVAYRHSPHGALLLGILLAAAWVAPLVAFASLASPPRAKTPPPPPGEGTYAEWRQQARLLGRVLLYYGDNPNLPEPIRQSLSAARADLRDTFGAHPLRDDLERVCQRVREGAIRDIQNWFAREYSPDIRELANAYEQEASLHMDDNQRLLALRAAVEKAAAMMSRNCMPRMLERERLACAGDCAWLAVQAAPSQAGQCSPVDLVEMLVIEWSDFSEPWLPANALQRALARMKSKERPPVPAPADPAPLPPTETYVIRNGKRYRRVRVRRKSHRSRAHPFLGPSLVEVFLSFGQWLRYTARSWLLYR